MLSLFIGGKSLPLDTQLNEAQLMTILDSYNSATLQKMVAGRGLSAINKKETNLKTLAKNFYDEKSIRPALQRLSPAGREALARLVRLGENGVLPFQSLKQQLTSRHNADFANTALTQITGSVLTLYAFRRNNNQLGFETPYNKHNLDMPGSYGMPYEPLPANVEAVVWLPPQIMKLVEIDPALEAELKPLNLQPYNSARGEPHLKMAARFEALLADIFIFTRYVEQNKPRILQSGDLGKRDFSKLASQLSIKDDTTAARKLEELPYLNFLWRILLQTGLLEVHQGSGQVWVGELLAEFYKLPRWQQARELVAGWARSSLEEFTQIKSLRFYTTDPLQSSVPTVQRQQQARTHLLQLWQQLYREKRWPAGTALSSWLDFASLLSVVKETDYELLISHTYAPDKSSYGGYYAYMGDFGRGYYKGFISQLKPANPAQKGRDTYGYGDRSRALSLDSDWDWVEGEWLALLLGESLSWLGLTELGVDEKTQRPIAFRFTEVGLEWLSGQPSQTAAATQQQLAQLAASAPELARPLIVQPNFDILVLDPLQNLALMRQLDQFAVQASLSEVALYRMSKESVLKGFRQGWDAASILKLLADNSRVPVAQNIETSLLDWGAAFERLILRPNTTLLEVGDPVRLERLVAERPDLGLRRLGEHFVLVAADKAQQAAQVLNSKAKPTIINTAQIVRGTLSFKDAYTLETRNTTPYQLYRLGQFADLVLWEQGQRQAAFKLTAQSVGRARQLGLSYQEITETYRQWLSAETLRERKRGLAQQGKETEKVFPETELALKGWLGEYRASGSMEFALAMLLQTTNPQVLDDLFRVERFAAYLLSRPAPTLALVKQAEFEEMRQELAKLELHFKEGITYHHTVPVPTQIQLLGLPQGRASSFASMLNALLGNGLEEEEDGYGEAEDSYFTGEAEEPEFIIHLIADIVQLARELRPGGPDYLNFLTGQQFAQRLLDQVEQEGFNRKKKTDDYWIAKHEEAHFYEELSTSERREILTESALAAMTSSIQSERQAAVYLLSLLGPRVARQLTEFLYHPDAAVRYNACLVLSEVGDDESLTHLQAVLHDNAVTSVGTVSQAAQQAVEAIRKRLQLL